MQPLLLVFEDLHWIDSETQALLDGLVEIYRPPPPAARELSPGVQPHLGQQDVLHPTPARPSPPESTEELLAACSATTALRAAEGAPLLGPRATPSFSRRASGPWPRPASWSASVAPTTWPEARDSSPATVQAVLAARIDRLPQMRSDCSVRPPSSARTCRSACSRRSPTDRRRSSGAGSQLQAAEFLYEARLFPDLEYTFKHALTHEVAYEGLTSSDRRRALDTADRRRGSRGWAVERARRTRGTANGPTARSGERSGPKLPTYLQQAGDRAVTRSAYRQAIVHFERALLALGHQPEGRETGEQFVDIKLSARGALNAVW